MLVYGVTEENLTKLADKTSGLYGGNVRLEIRGTSGRAIRCGLKVHSSKGDGAHRSWQGRRTVSACWHVWRDFLSALFSEYPDARCKTAMADYRGQASFLDKFEMTGMKNIGTWMQPVQAREACECAGW